MDIYNIYIDTFNGHKMILKEIRRDGNNLYYDTVDGSHVICPHSALSDFPPRTKGFEAVQFLIRPLPYSAVSIDVEKFVRDQTRAVSSVFSGAREGFAYGQ